ncbi:beta-galactosidase/beta-glucuronidase [Sphaerochaeta pleomorpha str. Grapes]|uniref:Beta-galactosidase n=1 Tax=Sphaerochaeta pleomorpha (strain ATCC BAA-1885 / DSM 22778 / Grapes) TaxID=158190 RepID=G8QSB9_SPHPG|nr:glycoside hydrolase family 2 TIM barrel-domain containing protein [Sphaerochaeta pleomorpha]AEV30049.1 beta-galactosidase/beta-glucuronidase [Sphaerochaeta pleomorpha str. Grapes]
MFNLSYLSDPEVFQINRVPAHADFVSEACKSISLDGTWHFLSFFRPEEADTTFLDPAKLDTMGTIEVPGHLQLQGHGLLQYTNTMYSWDGKENIVPPQIPTHQNLTGCYARTIQISRSQLEKEIRIRFEGSESNVILYVNGIFVGYSEDSFTPSEFCITNQLKEGDNLISVMVTRFCSGSWLEDQDFWRLSGIFRSVHLLILEKTHIEDVFLKPILNQDFSLGALLAKVQVAEATADQTVSLFVGDKLLAECKAGDSLSCTLENPLLWSAENPFLYHATIVLKDEKTILDKTTIPFGFRDIHIEGTTILLNGKRLLIHGVNRHEFHCKKGRAISKEDIYADLVEMKRNNINAVRTSHYPNQSCFYDFCDVLGLYVVDETNLETHGTWMVFGRVVPDEHTIPNCKEEWKEAVLDRASSMAMRDKNHPSIIFWSCGNESYGGSVLDSESDYFRSLNDNRLIHYEGIFHDRRYPRTSDVESRMYAKIPEIQEYSKHATKPFILCEYSHSMGNSTGNLEEYVALEQSHPVYHGGFIWDFVDQAFQLDDKNPDNLSGGFGFDMPTDGYFCTNGLLTGDRKTTAKMKEVKYAYSPFPMAGEGNKLTITNRNLFIDASSFLIAWTLLKEGVAVSSGSFKTDLGAGETKTFTLFDPLPDTTETYSVTGEIRLDVATKWAEKGFVIAKHSFLANTVGEVSLPQEIEPFIKGSCNIGYRCEKGVFLYSLFLGQWEAMLTNQGNLLSRPVKLETWRAPTNNDKGNGNTLLWAPYKLASLYQRCTKYHLAENVLSTVIATPSFEAECRYTCHGNTTTLTVLAPSFPTSLPCFGISFAIDKRYHNVKWFGNTVIDTYQDRLCGNLLGIAQEDASSFYTNHNDPQECGNLTDLRYLELTDDQGHGMRIRGEKPFEGSVLPYSCHELENATKKSELPTNDCFYVRILDGQTGVGGDDSWGAPVHDKYLYKGPEGPWRISFEIL